MIKSDHFLFLEESYNAVGKKTWKDKDFDKFELEASRQLFTEVSLKEKQPRPKELEVYALLSGLPFNNSFIQSLVEVQEKIDQILDGSLRYWVSPKNLGVEYCVLKWPDHDWNKDWEGDINRELSTIAIPSFEFIVYGIQINPDVCIVAKGYDEGGAIFKLREKMKRELSFYPEKQSGWAHIPLGRILEPLGEVKFSSLAQQIQQLSKSYIASCKIDSIKFIHEERWYMENKSVLREFDLNVG